MSDRHDRLYYISDEGGRNPRAVTIAEYTAHVARAGGEAEHWKTRIVAKDTPRDGVRVSTVLLPIDHQFVPGGSPLIYETMIFGLHEEHQWRYSTRDEALAGHARALEIATRSNVPEGDES